MHGNGSQQLTRRQQQGLEALLIQPDTRAAARAAGISESTLWRWLSDPFFSQAVTEARSRAFEGAIANLQQAMSEAVQALRDVLQEVEAKPGERVSAARAILEFALRSRELIDVERRLCAIEEILKKEATR